MGLLLLGRRRPTGQILVHRPISGGHRTSAGPAPELTDTVLTTNGGQTFTVLRQVGQGAHAAIYEAEAKRPTAREVLAVLRQGPGTRQASAAAGGS
ncbi:MAG: hypothetical protein ACYCW6_24875 [Candidatus Xenobia bacterium]